MVDETTPTTTSTIQPPPPPPPPPSPPVENSPAAAAAAIDNERKVSKDEIMSTEDFGNVLGKWKTSSSRNLVVLQDGVLYTPRQTADSRKKKKVTLSKKNTATATSNPTTAVDVLNLYASPTIVKEQLAINIDNTNKNKQKKSKKEYSSPTSTSSVKFANLNQDNDNQNNDESMLVATSNDDSVPGGTPQEVISVATTASTVITQCTIPLQPPLSTPPSVVKTRKTTTTTTKKRASIMDKMAVFEKQSSNISDISEPFTNDDNNIIIPPPLPDLPNIDHDSTKFPPPPPPSNNDKVEQHCLSSPATPSANDNSKRRQKRNSLVEKAGAFGKQFISPRNLDTREHQEKTSNTSEVTAQSNEKTNKDNKINVDPPPPPLDVASSPTVATTPSTPSATKRIHKRNSLMEKAGVFGKQLKSPRNSDLSRDEVSHSTKHISPKDATNQKEVAVPTQSKEKANLAPPPPPPPLEVVSSPTATSTTPSTPSATKRMPKRNSLVEKAGVFGKQLKSPKNLDTSSAHQDKTINTSDVPAQSKEQIDMKSPPPPPLEVVSSPTVATTPSTPSATKRLHKRNSLVEKAGVFGKQLKSPRNSDLSRDEESHSTKTNLAPPPPPPLEVVSSPTATSATPSTPSATKRMPKRNSLVEKAGIFGKQLKSPKTSDVSDDTANTTKKDATTTTTVAAAIPNQNIVKQKNPDNITIKSNLQQEQHNQTETTNEKESLFDTSKNNDSTANKPTTSTKTSNNNNDNDDTSKKVSIAELRHAFEKSNPQKLQDMNLSFPKRKMMTGKRSSVLDRFTAFQNVTEITSSTSPKNDNDDNNNDTSLMEINKNAEETKANNVDTAKKLQEAIESSHKEVEKLTHVNNDLVDNDNNNNNNDDDDVESNNDAIGKVNQDTPPETMTTIENNDEKHTKKTEISLVQSENDQQEIESQSVTNNVNNVQENAAEPAKTQDDDKEEEEEGQPIETETQEQETQDDDDDNDNQEPDTTTTKVDRDKMVLDEINRMIREVEDDELEDDMDEEVKEVLREAALKSQAYTKRWYDVFTDSFIHCPSLASIILDFSVLELAEEIYGEELPLLYTVSLRSVASNTAAGEEEVPDYVLKLAT